MALIKSDSSGTSRYLNLSIQNTDSYTRYWIGRLYETLYPPSFQLGNVANLDIAALPGFKVPKMWSLDILYSHQLYDSKNNLTMVCQIARFCFFLEKQKALGYVPNAPFINIFSTLPDFCRKPGEESIVLTIVHSLLRMEYQSIPRGVIFLK
jgi:hypothetical protein